MLSFRGEWKQKKKRNKAERILKNIDAVKVKRALCPIRCIQRTYIRGYQIFKPDRCGRGIGSFFLLLSLLPSFFPTGTALRNDPTEDIPNVSPSPGFPLFLLHSNFPFPISSLPAYTYIARYIAKALVRTWTYYRHGIQRLTEVPSPHHSSTPRDSSPSGGVQNQRRPVYSR